VSKGVEHLDPLKVGHAREVALVRSAPVDFFGRASVVGQNQQDRLSDGLDETFVDCVSQQQNAVGIKALAQSNWVIDERGRVLQLPHRANRTAEVPRTCPDTFVLLGFGDACLMVATRSLGQVL
jgi:hypothetical protein